MYNKYFSTHIFGLSQLLYVLNLYNRSFTAHSRLIIIKIFFKTFSLVPKISNKYNIITLLQSDIKKYN